MTEDIKQIREQLATAAHRAYARGVQTGNGGNLSARLDAQSMIIKPSGGSFIDCTADSWITTDFSGKKIEGNGKPSSEALLHGTIYRLSTGTNAIVHVHAPMANTMALYFDTIPAYAFHALTKLNGFIRVLDVKNDGVMEEDVPLVERYFAENPDTKAFVLRRHGVVALGKDPLEAEHNAELVEETASLAFYTAVYGKVMGVPAEALDNAWLSHYLGIQEGE